MRASGVPAKAESPISPAVWANPVKMDVDCPRCNVTTTHDVPAREAGRTDYPVKCPACHADFALWLDPQWFMS